LSQNDEAKEFLQNFLTQLARSDQTNRELLRTNLGLFQQNNQIIQALSTISAQLDGIAQRSDYLYEQMGRLGQLLVNDGSSPPPALPGEYYPGIDSMAKDLGRGVVDGLVSSFFPGQNARGRRRRR